MNMFLVLLFIGYMNKAEADQYDEAYQSAICTEVLGELNHKEESKLVEAIHLQIAEEVGPIGWEDLNVVRMANRRTRLQWLNFCYETYVKEQ